MKGKRWLVTAALLVAGIRMWMQVRGKTKTPFAEWAIGWGALFFFLAIISEAYPPAASSLAAVVVTGDFLANGATLFEDVANLTAGTITGGKKAPAGPILADAPFGSSPATPAAGSAGSAQRPPQQPVSNAGHGMVP